MSDESTPGAELQDRPEPDLPSPGEAESLSAPALWPRVAAVEIVQDMSLLSSPLEGYLRRHRHRVKAVLDDGTSTETFLADYVDRSPGRRDAVAVAVYARMADGAVDQTLLLLRRQLRYAAFLASGRPLMTELVAGILEGGESPEECGRRELAEEANLDVELSAFERLGPPFFILPGVVTERIIPLAVEVRPEVLREVVGIEPVGDGSPFEQGSELRLVSLGEAFAVLESGTQDPDAPLIDNAESELVLRRLRARLEVSTR